MKEAENELIGYLQEKHGMGYVSRLKHCFNNHFDSLDLENQRILEIGAGSGYMAALCMVRGASMVVALDPESCGATKGVNKQFVSLTESVKLSSSIAYLPISLEDYTATGSKETFDYILMCNVINHLDEAAVTKLHLPNARDERKQYIETFEEILNYLSEAGTLLVSDVGRYNFWNSIGLCFPTCHTIEWDKHQNPEVWKDLMTTAGFETVNIKWLPPYHLRHFKAIAGRKLVAQFLNSHFLIRAKKQDKAAR